jgi:hypothetical protein
MANEITVSGSLEFSKGSLDVDLSKGSLQVTVTGTEYIRNTLVFGNQPRRDELHHDSPRVC